MIYNYLQIQKMLRSRSTSTHSKQYYKTFEKPIIKRVHSILGKVHTIKNSINPQLKKLKKNEKSLTFFSVQKGKKSILSAKRGKKLSQTVVKARKHLFTEIYEEQEQIQPKNCKYLKIKEYYPIPLNRARMIDWLLEVCSGFTLKWEVYWSSIELLDILIEEFNYVHKENIHIVGITCLFISQKFHSYQPLNLSHILSQALHNTIPRYKILKQEEIILAMIGSSQKTLSFYDTIYTCLNSIFPKLKNNQKIQVLRQLVIIWMKPNECFRAYESLQRISYDKLVEMIVKSVKHKENFGDVEYVADEYSRVYHCENIIGYEKLSRIMF